jgi:hypothetical protein
MRIQQGKDCGFWKEKVSHNCLWLNVPKQRFIKKVNTAKTLILESIIVGCSPFSELA